MGRLSEYRTLLTRPESEVEHDLEQYSSLLRKWQGVQNLVSRETLTEVWPRHFLDSLQVLQYLTSNDVRMLDLGSGGGFPALPLAIAKKGGEQQFHLVEPTSRKVSFLRTVTRELELNVKVHGLRSEQLDSRETGMPHVITSRALAALPVLCSWMVRFFGPETRALLHKGREHVEELAETRALWDFDVLIHPSDSDASGVILEISNLRMKSAR